MISTRPEHLCDDHCTVVEGRCTGCGVVHSPTACADCGAHAFHASMCPQMLSADWLDTRSNVNCMAVLGVGSVYLAAKTAIVIAENAGFAAAREFLDQLADVEDGAQ